MTPTVQDVSAFAELINRYGALIIIGVTLGLFFLVTASVIFRRFFKTLEHGETIRETREKALEEDRRRLLDQVLGLTNDSTKTVSAVGEAVREVTKELVEFRRDTHRAFQELSEEHERRRTESVAQFERINLQNKEIASRLTRLERDLASKGELI